MRIDFYQDLILSLPYGKRLPNAVYLHRASSACGRGPLGDMIEELSSLHSIGTEFNVVKLRTDAPRISFLSYPHFDGEAHPALSASIAIDLASNKIYRTSYSDNPNPPILHRKELLMSPDDPRSDELRSLSAQEEALGLFDHTSLIGFRANWERLLAARGISFSGHILVQGCIPEYPVAHPAKSQVFRHRTALTRSTLSRPVRTLLEHEQLGRESTFFDFGCGLGADIRGLRELGYKADGWDPVHAPSVEHRAADVVNLGYVLNVIEDPAERLETLVRAWLLTKHLLVVSALVGEPSHVAAIVFGDGILTQRQTFQKYFSQVELQRYVEDALEAEAVAVGMGVLYVFREAADAQLFLRSRSRRVTEWGARSSANTQKQISRSERKRKRPPEKYEEHRDTLETFWQAVLQYGRIPLLEECSACGTVREIFGSEGRALRILLNIGRQQLFDDARTGRRNDLLVYLAAANLRRHIAFQQLPPSLRADIREFFGTYKRALAEGLAVVRSSADPQMIVLACDDTAEGWQDEAALYVPVDAVSRLPTVLRVYVACAELLFGVVAQADIIKLHKRSGKVTFLSYHNFDTALAPRLTFRSKVNLRTGSLDVFDHRGQGQLLLCKERFIPDEHIQQPALTALSRALQSAGVESSGVPGLSAQVVYTAAQAVSSDSTRAIIMAALTEEVEND